jgi:hypothetical protein
MSLAAEGTQPLPDSRREGAVWSHLPGVDPLPPSGVWGSCRRAGAPIPVPFPDSRLGGPCLAGPLEAQLRAEAVTPSFLSHVVLVCECGPGSLLPFTSHLSSGASGQAPLLSAIVYASHRGTWTGGLRGLAEPHRGPGTLGWVWMFLSVLMLDLCAWDGKLLGEQFWASPD